MVYTNLYSFSAVPNPSHANNDGANPAGLILSGNTLYGTASSGGSSGQGTVFAIKTDGTGFTNLYSFAATAGSKFTNSYGAKPSAGLILSGNTLYGTAKAGGSSGNGTVFALNTNGAGITVLHSFSGLTNFDSVIGVFTNSDGVNPQAALILSGNVLYGTANKGGVSGFGTVFSLALPAPPQLAIQRSGTNVILTWPAVGFNLQSTTNLVSPVWSAISGQNVVTNHITGSQQFFRLVQ